MIKVGVLLDCLLLPFTEAVETAAVLGAEGVQFYAVYEGTAPWIIPEQDQKQLKQIIRSSGLELSALCGELGGHGFERPQENREKIEKTKQIMDMAALLETSVVTGHIGVVPDPDHSRYKTMVEAMREIASYGKERGVFYGIETGAEPSLVLRKFIEDVGEANLKVNIDPANLAMVQGEEAGRSVRNLEGLIVHAHAKDGIMIKKPDPEALYGAFAEGTFERLPVSDYIEEKPLGKGAVDFSSYLQALKSIDYSGHIVVERESGTDRKGEIGAGVSLLREKLEEVK
jgi:sugar phosphate isomerase/epimerase